MTTLDRPATAELASVRVTGGGASQDLRAIKVVMARELIRFRQDKIRIVSALVQPVLFIFVLGTGLSSITDQSTSGLDFRTFMFPGVLATSVLFTAVFSAMSIVWDREFGFLREMLVAPVRRSSIIVGKALGGALVATIQGLLVLAFAPLVDVPLHPVMVVVLAFEIFLLSFTLTSMGLVMAARIQQMQTMMGIMQMVLLPLSFLSGALYPIDNLPKWLHTLVMINPVTYAVHAVRSTVFHYLDAPQQAKDALNPPLTWNGWVVPMGVQLGVVIVLGLGLMLLAAQQFEKAE
ncbi:MAG: ABC transporter permease [Acidimicrobiales bacterium]|nr:ABC transporter permease [Acidimicrobiales bacterium]HRW37618.1 ABC transporter permease [Aquihabitans sp.]